MQDRSRLLPVAARLVGLGADLDATDAEGRTALHLAAGCGDRTMVLQLVELGSDVNAHDSVGGALETFAYSRPCRTVSGAPFWNPQGQLCTSSALCGGRPEAAFAVLLQ